MGRSNQAVIFIAIFLFSLTSNSQEVEAKEINAEYVFSEIKNNKQIAIYFWEPWCKPGRKDLDTLLSVNPNLKIIAVSNTSKNENFKNYKKYKNISFYSFDKSIYKKSWRKNLRQFRDDVIEKCIDCVFFMKKPTPFNDLYLFENQKLIYRTDSLSWEKKVNVKNHSAQIKKYSKK